jgi:flagellar basal-body rod protein FlgC
MNAERIRMEVASQNIANSRVTRTESGEAYRRQQVVFEAVLQQSQSALGGGTNPIQSVQVARIEEDKSPLKRVYDPEHPDASVDGYVHYPNVDINREMVDLMMASRAYEANVAAMKFSRTMASEALSIGKSR